MPVFFAVERRASPIERSMGLIRYLTHLAAIHGFDFQCRWVKGLLNVAADRLSRGDMQGFREEVPTANAESSEVGHLPPFHAM